jgi:hypothetical protein
VSKNSKSEGRSEENVKGETRGEVRGEDIDGEARPKWQGELHEKRK